MKTDDSVIGQLKRELAFLDRGGYRIETSWKAPRYFEDSPICMRGDGVCKPACALVNFVPGAFRNEAVPCRYIPLNEKGETLESLYRTGTNQEIEDAVRHWLTSAIGELERGTSPEKTAPGEKVVAIGFIANNFNYAVFLSDTLW